MLVLQVCQWRVAEDKGNILNYSFVDFAEADQDYYFRVCEVNPAVSPPLGRVWFKEDELTGKMMFFKANYDTSD